MNVAVPWIAPLTQTPIELRVLATSTIIVKRYRILRHDITHV